MITAFIAGLAIQPGKPNWTLKVKGYKLVHWTNPDGDRQTMYLLDQKKRIVFALQDYHVGVIEVKREESSYWDPPKNILFNLLGEGSNDIVMTEWTGGAHASVAYYVFKLGSHPKCLLAYNKKNIFGSDEDLIHDFQPSDLNGDARKGILSFYDGFAYYHWNAYGAMLPYVMEYRNGNYRNATTKYKSVLRQWIDEAQDNLADLKPRRDRWENAYKEVGLRLYGLGILNRSVASTTKYLRHELPREDFRWVIAQRAYIRRVVAQMDGRIHTVPLYRNKPFSMYVPLKD